MTYDPAIEATDPVVIVHEQMHYWRRKTYPQMIEAVTGWKVHLASREVAFEVLMLAWLGTRGPRDKLPARSIWDYPHA